MAVLNFDSNRMRPAFFRRYKWAFRPEYDNINTQTVGHPELYRLLPLCADIYLVRSYRHPLNAHVDLRYRIIHSLHRTQ